MEVLLVKMLKVYLYFVSCATKICVCIQVEGPSLEALCLKRTCFWFLNWSRPAVHAAIMEKAPCCTVEICTPTVGLRKTANTTLLNVRTHTCIHTSSLMQTIRKENDIKHIYTLAFRPEVSGCSLTMNIFSVLQ